MMVQSTDDHVDKLMQKTANFLRSAWYTAVIALIGQYHVLRLRWFAYVQRVEVRVHRQTHTRQSSRFAKAG